MRKRTPAVLAAAIGLLLAVGCASSEKPPPPRTYYDPGGSIHRNTFPSTYGTYRGVGRPRGRW